MIHALRADKAGITLYNADRQEIKVVGAQQLLSLIQQGFLLDNDEQFRAMLEDGKQYGHFIKGMVGNTKLLLANIDNPDDTKEVSAFNLNIENISNGVTYRMVFVSDEKLGVDIGLQRTDIDDCFTIDYTVPCGIDYETAKGMAHEVNSDLEQLLSQVGIFGDGATKALGVQQTRIFPKLYEQSPAKTLNIASEDTLNIMEGVSIVRSDVTRGTNITKIILPSSFIMSDFWISTEKNLELIDMRKASVKEFSFLITGSHYYSKQSRSDGPYAKNVYLPDSMESFLLESGADVHSITMESNVKIQNLFIGKNTKRIESGCAVAHCVILEKGINLEYIGEFGVVARFIIMSDDPNYDKYVNCGYFEDLDIADEEYTMLDIGNNVRILPNSFRILPHKRTAIRIRIRKDSIKGTVERSMDLRDEDGNRLHKE